MKENLNFIKKHFVTDLSSGLVVFLIALPLCLGISLASGAPLFSGIIAGIIGGIVVGITSNSSVNVSGPAASVALVIFTAIQTLGSFEAVLVAVILAGIIQIGLGYLKAGTVAYFFPNAMIKGILASIGLILILKQIPHAFGVDEVFKGIDSFKNNDGTNTFSGLMNIVGHINYGALIITLVSLFIIIVWDRPVLKKFTFFKFFPSALAAVIISILLNEYFKALAPDLALNTSHLVNLPVSDSIGEFFNFFQFPDFSVIANMEVYTIALSIAFIASLESLLSTEAGDKLDPYKRRTSTNRELKAQGIGNIVSGLIGGLPVTAVIVRTSANVNAGGRTKTATITHGVIMFVCVLAIPYILNLIPLAALSAVLFVVGYKLTSLSIYKSIFKQGKKQFLPFIITILVVMFTDLITGIIVGGTIAIFFILRDNYKNAYIHDKHSGSKEKKVLKLAQETTFLNKADIMLYLDHVPEGSHLLIDGSEAKFVHHDIFEIIEEFKQTAKFKDIDLEIKNLDKSLTTKFWKKQ
ncbi:MAG: SulP family inorganic anion transporter [Psychroflexus sp.]